MLASCEQAVHCVDANCFSAISSSGSDAKLLRCSWFVQSAMPSAGFYGGSMGVSFKQWLPLNSTIFSSHRLVATSHYLHPDAQRVVHFHGACRVFFCQFFGRTTMAAVLHADSAMLANFTPDLVTAVVIVDFNDSALA